MSRPASGARGGEAGLLALLIAGALALRIAAFAVLAPPLESDALSYVTMARSLVAGGPITDNFGQHIFYSPGYALWLAPFYALADRGAATALAANLPLCVLTMLLVRALALTLGGSRTAARLVMAGHALWLPAIWSATLAARENLFIPLLLALLLASLHLLRGPRWPLALLAGLLWGAALLTGGSGLPLVAGPVLAILLATAGSGKWRQGLASLAAVAIGGAVVLTPWLHATQRMAGAPMLSSSAPFNLYLGNNPAATGAFVSIADTPLGRDWEATRLRLGEVGTARLLQGEAVGWIAHNPDAAARLALRKLWLFWTPNLPDAADFARSRPLATVRLVEVAQWALILIGAAVACVRWSRARGQLLVLGGLLGSYWLVHAAAYIIPRYRDPAMAVLLVLAALAMASIRRGQARSREGASPETASTGH